MFRRHLRRILFRPPGRSAQVDEIVRAGQLLASGKPEQAAILFTQLANQMEALGRPRQAANLHAQAAHTWLDAGNEAHALQQAHMALDLLARLGMGRRMREFRRNFADHLQACNSQEVAQRFEQEAGFSPPSPVSEAELQPKRGMLPATCPHCGAPLRSDWVEWIDDRSAACDFCGSTIHTTD